MNNKPFVLYAEPSLWEGMVRIVDVAGALNEYNVSSSPEEADYKALLSDWEAIGRDIWQSIRQFEGGLERRPANG
ncbi:MAG: hypothetical protein IT330_01715 [Anaerolineae bacterium]|nr:hypothetical protein [Anaerolineae bacterium]